MDHESSFQEMKREVWKTKLGLDSEKDTRKMEDKIRWKIVSRERVIKEKSLG